MTVAFFCMFSERRKEMFKNVGRSVLGKEESKVISVDVGVSTAKHPTLSMENDGVAAAAAKRVRRKRKKRRKRRKKKKKIFVRKKKKKKEKKIRKEKERKKTY